MRYFLYLCNYVYCHLVLKKIIFLVLFLSVLVGKSFSSEIEFLPDENDTGGKTSSVVIDAKKKKTFDYSVELFSGAKLDFEGITAGARLKLPFYDIKTYFKNEDWTFGCSVFTGNYCKTLPITLKVGKLSPGGSYSKLKSPLISTSVAPFSSISESAKSFTCNLPSYSSFDKNLSSFFQVSLTKISFIKKMGFSVFFDKKNEIVGSFDSSFDFSKNVKLYLSYICGNFLFDEKTYSSWFSDFSDSYYPGGEHFCSNFQLGLKLNKYFSLFSVGIYENPFGNFNHIYSFDNKIKFNKVVLNLRGLLNLEKNIITSGNKIINEILEVKGGFQYNFLKNMIIPFFFKFGFNSYLRLNLAEENHDVKFGIGFQGNCLYTSFSLIGLVYGDINSPKNESFNFDLTSTSIQLKNSWYFSKFNFTLSGKFSFYPKFEEVDQEYDINEFYYLGINKGKSYFSYKTDEKISLNLSFNSIVFLTLSNSFSIYQENGNYKKSSFDSSINLKYQIKSLSVKLKFTMNFDF